MTDRLERLINLVIALRESPRPMTAEDVRRRVAGYDQTRKESFRRAFERDKADLRAMGVPVESVPVGLRDDTAAYRIDPASYDLPPIDLAPDELAALALAVHAAGLGPSGRSGLGKLAVDADGDARGDGSPAGLAIDLGAVEALGPISRAAAERRVVTFGYAAASGARSQREVEPHGVVHRRGRWYLVAHDRDRDARRAFRLDRIIGAVTIGDDRAAFAAPDGPLDPSEVLPEADRVRAQVRAAAGAAAALRRRGTVVVQDDVATAQLDPDDPEQVLRWAAGWAGAVVVTQPPELVHATTEALAAVVLAHGGTLDEANGR